LAAKRARGESLGNLKTLTVENRQKAAETTKNNALLRNAKYEKVVMDYYRQGDTAYKIAKTLTGLPTPNGSQNWQALQVKRVIERLTY
jgi:hypothetical protein